ncbi:MAG: hypothetical protein KBT63_02920 [Porticoccaceae bacterium]|nr:hypothetical protein [Porticoccaceae bacterium]
MDKIIPPMIVTFVFGALALAIVVLVTPSMTALAIELRHIVHLGKYQILLGDVVTSLIASVVAAIPLGLLVKQRIFLWALIAALVYPATFIYLGLWPNNNHVLISGWAVHVAFFLVFAWGANRALTNRSRNGTREKLRAP